MMAEDRHETLNHFNGQAPPATAAMVGRPVAVGSHQPSVVPAGPVGSILVPEPLSQGEVRFPDWSPEWEAHVGVSLQQAVTALGWDETVLAAWGAYLSCRFFPALRDWAQYLRHQGEITAARVRLRELQGRVTAAMLRWGLAVPGNLEQLDEGAVDSAIDLKLQGEQQAATLLSKIPYGEQIASHAIKSLLAVPLLAVLFQALRISWTPTSVVVSALFSLCVCRCWMLGARGVYELIGRNEAAESQALGERAFAPPSPLTRTTSRVLAGLLVAVMLAMTYAFWLVDTRFLVFVTALDKWGRPNRFAMSPPEAGAVAFVFQGLLIVSSLGYLLLTHRAEWKRRTGEARRREIKNELSEPLTELAQQHAHVRSLEAQVHGEAATRLYSARQAAWMHMLETLSNLAERDPEAPGAAAALAMEMLRPPRRREAAAGAPAQGMAGWLSRLTG